MLPEKFGSLVNLNKLEADNNLLSELPDGFDQLVKLAFLNLSKNKFKIFPVEIRSFSLLSTFKIASNKSITEIPDWLN